ncbi:hypothetical protein BFP72_18065 [Reichenbachiella sp. 5M10]|uniref:CotH kinase family protein n=1 Tax=Reichenbachiella sp. 5M10 TaxID=1889772 RepID=UPI000C159D24|nr:CotH kinase family protein [Reichenbachiella sp. 5M10]PIB37176.1 hypothetical protein BFP72_18065 [Reichenbachiella sp. 5M10]
MKRFTLLLFAVWAMCCTSMAQTFTDSNLPIVLVDTDNDQTIPDEPKVWADMKIIYRGEGERNYLNDQNTDDYLDFDSRIKIEVRGSSSQSLAKKQYGFTTYTTDGSDKDNVSLLDMPKENDWILSGIAYDSSLIRDYLCYELSRQLGNYAPRTRYCELILNGSYNGLYILMEKIKADDNRVDIDQIEESAATQPDLSGGYITQADRADDDPLAWSMSTNTGQNVDYVHVVPKPEDATNTQTSYIESVFIQLASTSRNQNSDKADGYPSLIDIPSFIDFMLINELSSNSDAYQYSTYFHKDKMGKLRAGPIWDLNLTFDNDLRFWGLDRSKPDIWQFDNGDNVGSKFWLDLYEDDTYRCYLSKRWNELTTPDQPLNETRLNTRIDEIVAEISEATIREEARWGTIVDHDQHITQIKDFLSERITWMTTELGDYSACAAVSTPPLVITKIHYNPEDQDPVESKELEFIEILNNGSTTVDLTGVYFGGTGLVYQFAESTLAAGATTTLASNASIYEQKYGLAADDQYYRSLSNGGQRIQLLDAYGNTIDEVTYSDEGDWPDADGSGYYLELSDPNSDNNVASNWIRTKDVDFVPLSTGEKKSSDKVLLYPNPSTGSIHVQAQEDISELHITNLNGQVVFMMQPHSPSATLTLTALQPGVYFVHVRTATNQSVTKMLRN